METQYSPVPDLADWHHDQHGIRCQVDGINYFIHIIIDNGTFHGFRVSASKYPLRSGFAGILRDGSVADFYHVHNFGLIDTLGEAVRSVGLAHWYATGMLRPRYHELLLRLAAESPYIPIHHHMVKPDTEEKSITGKELAVLRKQKGLTQQELGERVGFPKANARIQVSAHERGVKGISGPVAKFYRVILELLPDKA